jgi:four helix bundle protein
MDHKDLDGWKKPIDFVTDIYSLSDTFPKSEMYGLVNQLRRAAVSIPGNIAEGAARQSDKEFIQYLYIELGSIAETETQLIIAENLKYMRYKDTLSAKLQSVRKMLLGLIKYLKNK